MSDMSKLHPPEEDLHAYLDGELSTDQQRLLEDHVAACPTCTRNLDSLRTLFSQIESLSDAALEADLSPSVLEAIAARPVMESHWWRLLVFQVAVFSAAAIWLSSTLRDQVAGALLLVQNWVSQLGIQPDLLELVQRIQLSLAQLQPQVPGVFDLSIPRLVPPLPEPGWVALALFAGLAWLLANRWLLTGTSLKVSRPRRRT